MAIQLVSILILSRLLDPRDYGLIAMVMTVINFGEIFRDFGLSTAAIQAPTLSRPERDNLFWANTGLGSLLAIMVFLGAPLLASAYEQDQLVGITHALAITFILNGLTAQFRASLIRGLRFKSVALIDITAALTGLLTAVTCALGGLGVWSLVVQQLTSGLTLLSGTAIAGRWLPRAPHRGVSIRHHARFGGNLLAAQVVGYAANNTDTWTVGLRFGPDVLGAYSRAFQLIMTPMNQIRSPSTTVAIPVLARISDAQARFDDYLRKGQLALALPTTLGLGIVIGAAPNIVAVFLGSAWGSSTPYVQFFAVAAIFQTLGYVGYWVYLTRGLTRVLFHYAMVESAIRVAAVVIGSVWGSIGVAAGFAIAPIICLPLTLFWLGRATPTPTRDLLVSAARILLQSAPACAASFAVTIATPGWPPLLSLLAAALAGIAIYAALVATLPVVRRDVTDVLSMARLVTARHASNKPASAPESSS